jgi:hypothetical protein
MWLKLQMELEVNDIPGEPFGVNEYVTSVPKIYTTHEPYLLSPMVPDASSG